MGRGRPLPIRGDPTATVMIGGPAAEARRMLAMVPRRAAGVSSASVWLGSRPRDPGGQARTGVSRTRPQPPDTGRRDGRSDEGEARRVEDRAGRLDRADVPLVAGECRRPRGRRRARGREDRPGSDPDRGGGRRGGRRGRLSRAHRAGAGPRPRVGSRRLDRRPCEAEWLERRRGLVGESEPGPVRAPRAGRVGPDDAPRQEHEQCSGPGPRHSTRRWRLHPTSTRRRPGRERRDETTSRIVQPTPPRQVRPPGCHR